MPNPSAEKHLVELERKYWQAMKDRDLETAMSLTDDPCVVAGPQGFAVVDRPTYEKMWSSDKYTLDRFELGDDVTVRMLNDDTGIVAYRVTEELTVEGKPVKLEAADSSVWIRKGDRWVCSLHTESIRGDPFGRDRH